MRIENQRYVSSTANSGYVNRVSQNSELSRQQTNGAKLNKIPAPSRRDTIEISQHSQVERPTLVQAREQIVTSLHQEKSTEFLEDLRSRIAPGDYKIDPYELTSLPLDGSIRSAGLLYHGNTAFRAAEPSTARSNRMDRALSEEFMDSLSRYLVLLQGFFVLETQKYQDISQGQVDKLNDYVKVEEVFILRSKGTEVERERLVQCTQVSALTFRESLPRFDLDIRQRTEELFGDFSVMIIELKEMNLRCNYLTEPRLRRVDAALKKMKKQPKLQKKYDVRVREGLNSAGFISKKV